MTEATSRPASWSGLPRWLVPVLMTSLALNLVVAGSMLGQKLRPAPVTPPGIAARLAQDASAPLLRDLPPERRAEMRAVFEAHRGKNRALWQAVRDRRADVTKVLEATPFDKAAYVAAMTRLIETEATARTAAQPTFAEAAALLSVKERQDFLANHRQLRQQLVAPAREGGQRDGGQREGRDRK